jgi:hypothetical protein
LLNLAGLYLAAIRKIIDRATMVNVHPSSLIGAQAYAAQLRRQYGQEETARAFNAEDPQAGRADRHARRAAAVVDKVLGDAGKTQPHSQTNSHTNSEAVKIAASAAQNPAAGNPTTGELKSRPNPPARPLYSSSNREAPNPNAQLRNIRPGTHLDITI